MLAATVSILLLAIVAQGQFGRRSLAARVAARFADGDRRWRTFGWAVGTGATYAVPAIVALLLLGRLDTVVTLPAEFTAFARGQGLPAAITAETAEIAGSLFLGMLIGTALVVAARLLKRRPSRLLYRSPAAARGWHEAPAAAALALSAGISEELFFRLALPLSVATATGSVVAGLASGAAAFGLAHRYQGAIGLVLTSLVGAGLAWFHLWTGALWFAMAVHTTVDLHALIVRPWIGGWQPHPR